MKDVLTKGDRAEEVLRNYFISMGYFVVRGCKYRYSGFDVTDIDLWVYGKSSGITRERLNVDIKNKKSPQALERIFWTKGLQEVLGLDGSVVVTNDSREAVRSFGLQHAVMVFDAAFYSRLLQSERGHQDRIAEEELMIEIELSSLGKLGGDWRGKYEASKTRLLDSLSFDGSNAWLDEIDYFLRQIAQSATWDSSAWRLTYLSISKYLISVDFLLARHLTADKDERMRILNEGFRYGSSGEVYTEKVGNIAASLVKSMVPTLDLGKSVQSALRHQAMSLKTEILAEYFSSSTISSSLFELAREFESAGFAKKVPRPGSLNKDARAIVGVLSDYYGIDRKRTLN